MGTANGKSTIGTHTKKKKNSKHNTKASHQTTTEESEVWGKEGKKEKRKGWG